MATYRVIFPTYITGLFRPSGCFVDLTEPMARRYVNSGMIAAVAPVVASAEPKPQPKPAEPQGAEAQAEAPRRRRGRPRKVQA